MDKETLQRFFLNKLSEEDAIWVRDWLLDPENRDEVIRFMKELFEEKGETVEHMDVPAFEEIWVHVNSEAEHSLHVVQSERTRNYNDERHSKKLKWLKSRHTWINVAASLFFICIGAWAGYYLNASVRYDGFSHVESRDVRGMKVTEIAMIDGSKFVLEPNSKLSYRKSSVNETTIYLDGAAYFDIGKGDKNYTIKTKDISASTKDGKINISAYHKDSTVKILVSEGSAELHHPKVLPMKKLRPAYKLDTSTMLLKIVSNEEAVFNRSTKTTKIQPVDPSETPLMLLYPVNTDNSISETLEFTDITLDDLLLELQKRFNLVFEKQSGLKLKTHTFSGRFNIKENPFHILILACEKMGITYEVENEIILIRNTN